MVREDGLCRLLGLKFNAIGVVTGDVTIVQNAPNPLTAVAGSFNGDGTGPFGFGIYCAACGSGASDKFNSDIVFSVANATIADLTTPNVPQGNVFVADILSDATLGGTGNTGPVDATVPVPEPATLALLSGGLAGLAAFGRRYPRA